jgi:hypothetical protein
MKSTTIKPGYRLSVTSWENDGDHYKTNVLEGLSKEKVQFYVDLLSLFVSELHGNAYEPSAQELQVAVQAMTTVADLHRGTLEPEEYRQCTEDSCAFMHQFLGHSENYAFRVFDSMLVQFVPTEIILQDVTSEFQKD